MDRRTDRQTDDQKTRPLPHSTGSSDGSKIQNVNEELSNLMICKILFTGNDIILEKCV